MGGYGRRGEEAGRGRGQKSLEKRNIDISPRTALLLSVLTEKKKRRGGYLLRI